MTPAENYSAGTWAFLRLLGLCHLIAFASIWVQIDGLIGDKGISPAGPWLEAVSKQIGHARFWQVPTLCWWNPSDAFRHTLCLLGMGCGLAATIGIATRYALIALWIAYLSLASVGGVFFGFQWDALLLEATLFGIFAAPKHWSPSLPWRSPAPSRLALGALWWLVFRLILLSGAVKILSHDKLWANLSALSVHFQTQPLPTPLAWWLHQLPAPLLTAACAVMFAIELGLPFFILFGRAGRRLASLGICALMGLIALSGNYCFFNLLVIALALPLIDDSAWNVVFKQTITPTPTRATHKLLPVLSGALLLTFLWCSALQTAIPLLQIKSVPAWMGAPLQTISPFRSINSYGLFAVMTPTRPEIILEGSADGRSWKEYTFKWKPGPTTRSLPMVAPHQPRLDWQMWFASLSEMRHNPWFSNFLVRILQAEPAVLSLLETNPFPDAPPKLLRAALFHYKFTDKDTRERTGQLWERDYRGDYCPPISLSTTR